MIENIVYNMREKLQDPAKTLPASENSRIVRQTTTSNYERLQYLLLFTTVFSIIVLIHDFFFNDWDSLLLLRFFIFVDTFLLVVSILGLLYMNQQKNVSALMQKRLVQFYLSIGAIWIGIVSGYEYPQNHLTFVIGTFVLSGGFILRRHLHTTILVLQYGVYLLMEYTLDTLGGHNVFTEVFILPISLIIAWLYSQNAYKNKFKGLENELRFETYANNLEEIVNHRTNALKNKNRTLVKEIKGKQYLHNQLQASEELFKKLLYQSADAIAIFEMGGYVVKWNPKMEKYTGVDSKSALGNKIWHLLKPPTKNKQSHATFFRQIEEYIENVKTEKDNTPLKVRHWIKDKLGKERYIETNIFPIILNQKLLFGSISRNITQQVAYEKHLKEARSKAETANNDKTNFLVNVSHDLRSPLNSISGFSQLLDLKPDLSRQKQKKYLGIIYENSQYLLQLINSLIDLSKLQTGVIAVEKEQFAVREFMKQITSFAVSEKTLHAPQIKINQACKASLLVIESDRTKLLQIFTNLISNAIKFTPDGTISYGCKIIENAFHGFVEDTGVGMTEEEVEKAFNRFFTNQGPNNKQGKGIGLAIVKGYVELIGGSIKIASTYGKGTRFDFQIPVTIINKQSDDRT
ncbi:MAG: PAS domain-containing sensor histidine kinase [Salinivirgaceae bacterium]|jgi:PAS domain S-box-containing protein|nr:PAS domain-containing sensor histidine kinase [Salinivirgaceae bacterium]